MDHRQRIREIERLRAINQSPWSIGVSHWNQRDLYTKNSRIEDDGYGRGPAVHPEEGSYAYPRELRIREAEPDEKSQEKSQEHARHLNHEAPHREGVWDKLKVGVAELLHVGKAPKNATRFDARVKEDVSDALMYRGDLDATDIEVTVHAGEVTLDGTVTDRRSKHIAEEVCEGIVGVRDVHNRLTIRKDDPTDANVVFVLPVALFGC